jgi:hypothetical protein
MELEFLKQFPKRMKSVGAYALLFKNSMNKGTWKQFGFEEYFEQTNITIAVLLYVMEQSLKDEPCTMDDIGGFIDFINTSWFRKPLSYETCRELGDFIINVVLCDEGKAMYFKGFDFEIGDYKELHISFVANKIIYIDEEVRRTSYYLTDEGYNLMLSTLELESNMKLTIHEMIFKLHLEKATYDQAVDDIKNIFNLLRIQLQKMQEAMRKIRQNALLYSVEDYKTLLQDNLNTISDTKKKFLGYRDTIKERVKELEEQDINIKKLEKKDMDNLRNLKIIEGYLNRTIEEHQKILSTHFDLKSLYTKELEDLSQMAFIQRFHIRNEIYDKILQNPATLDKLDIFMGPLFNREMEQNYNINKILEFQKPIYKREIAEEEEILDFDENNWQEEQHKKQVEKLLKYKKALQIVLDMVVSDNEMSLSKLKESLSNDMFHTLIPTVEIFKEIMIELLKSKTIDIDALKQEQQEHVTEHSYHFNLNECILGIVNENPEFHNLKYLHINKIKEVEPVVFEAAQSELGVTKKILCSDVMFLSEFEVV